MRKGKCYIQGSCIAQQSCLGAYNVQALRLVSALSYMCVLVLCVCRYKLYAQSERPSKGIYTIHNHGLDMDQEVVYGVSRIAHCTCVTPEKPHASSRDWLKRPVRYEDTICEMTLHHG